MRAYPLSIFPPTTALNISRAPPVAKRAMCTSKLNSPAAKKCTSKVSVTAARTLRALKTYSSLQSQGESLITLITFRRRWTRTPTGCSHIRH